MPNKSTRDTISRQWEMLKQLPGGGAGKTANELTQELNNSGFKVDKRTVERDLQVLRGLFPAMECNDKGTPYGWRWQPGSSADLPGMTLTEALSLQLIGEILKPLLPDSVLKAVEPRLKLAAEKLANELANQRNTRDIARWADKVRTIPPTLPLLPPKVDEDVLKTVQSALLHENQMEADYHPMDAAEPQTYTLHPLALVQRGPVTYLTATAFNYHDPRIYALHRITRAETLTTRAKTPEGFNIDHYIQSGAFQFGSGKFITLQAKVAPWLARILEETPLSEDQNLEPDGDEFRLSATVADSWQLLWWVLSQGDAIQVVKPKVLRRKVMKNLNSASSTYQLS